MSETLYGLWESLALKTDKSGGGSHQKIHQIQAGMGFLLVADSWAPALERTGYQKKPKGNVALSVLR